MISTAQESRPSSKDIIAANVAQLIEQLNSGKSESLTAYLSAMARFHDYSFANTLSIFLQRPSATRVAGFHAWHSFGRHVRKGEKGIRILAPMIGKREDPATGESTARVFGFRNVYVFDVAQTDGAALPTIDLTVAGEVAGNLDALRTFAASQSITVAYDSTIAPALGVSRGGSIGILPGQSPAEEFATLAHEVAHALLHRGADRPTSKTIRETEAEATAFIVCSAIGLTPRGSCDYIQLYNGDAATLTASLTAIQSAAHSILDALQAASEPLALAA